jgi:large-conductance mechanosensitive channel
MHFSNFRILCHDDIRAIRMVYKLNVKRDNAIYDDTCRRDFPMNKLQKLMYKIGRILNIILIGFFIISLIVFILTLIYLLIKYLSKQKSNQFEKQSPPPPINSTIIKDEKPMIKIKRNVKSHGYLWHDDMI